MNDSVRMLHVARDPTADDSGQVDQVIVGTSQSYPGSEIVPGTLWHNTITGELFMRMPPGPPVLVQVVPIDPATHDPGNYTAQEGHLWRNTSTGSLFVFHDGEWLRCVSDVPPGPYERV